MSDTMLNMVNVEAERDLLGALMAMPGMMLELDLQPEHFGIERHGIVFSALLDLASHDRVADPLVLQDYLESQEERFDIGFLAELADRTGAMADIESYANIVKQDHRRRQIFAAAHEALQAAVNGHDVDKTLAELASATYQVWSNGKAGDIVSIKDVASDFLDKMLGNEPGTAVKFGFQSIDDRMHGGVKPQELVTVAGRTGMGKTRFLLDVAANMAGIQNKVVAMFSLEMSYEQLLGRLIARELGFMKASVDISKLRSNGPWTEAETKALMEAVARVAEYSLHLDDTAGITVGAMRGKLRKLQMETGLDIVLVDYIQLMRPEGKHHQSRVQEVTEITYNLKNLAKEFNVPVIAAAQLSRAVEQRQNKRPALSDLRESGSIEQDSDIVIFLYRDEYYDPATEKRGIAEVITAKFRDGEAGTDELQFSGATGFRSLSRAVRESWEI